MIKNRNIPVATQDLKTCVHHAHSWNRLAERPEAFIARTLAMMDEHTVTIFAGVQEVQAASRWEYNMIGFLPTTAPTYEEFAALREKMRGYFILSVNFEEVSHAVRILTRDAELIAAWRAAIESNPGYPAAAKWHADTAASLAAKRTAFERRNPEVARG